ncbi:hypothetical protein MSA92_12365 [bacterium]|nr:hypothetical protein [bacterium]MDY2885349.1 hypothetical protein [Bariatricus sp.]
MLYKNGCADAWETVIRIYDETIEQNNPAVTAEKIVSEIGLSNAMEVFSVVAAIKKKDGRITPANRRELSKVPIDPDAAEWQPWNPMLRVDLDHIHPAHINNIISALLNIARQAECSETC